MNIQRTCGECTACCLAIAVDELSKPMGQLCRYCNQGAGCQIYERRPVSCQDFKCEWLKLGNYELFGDEYRPDRCGFILDYCTTGILGPTLQVWEFQSPMLGSPLTRQITLWALHNPRWSVLYLYLNGEQRLFLPPNSQLGRHAQVMVGREKIIMGDLADL